MKKESLDIFYKYQSSLYDFTREFFLRGYGYAVKSLDIQKTDFVIDLACGTGRNIVELKKQKLAYREIVGVDYSISLLSIFKKKLPNIETIQADLETYIIPADANKLIISYGLSMMDNWENVLKNILNGMKKGSTLVVLDFNPRCKNGIVLFIHKLLSLCSINLKQKDDISMFLESYTFQSYEKNYLYSDYIYCLKIIK